MYVIHIFISAQTLKKQKQLITETEGHIDSLVKQKLITINKGIQIFNRNHSKVRKSDNEFQPMIVVQQAAASYVKELNNFSTITEIIEDLKKMEHIILENIMLIIARCKLSVRCCDICNP